MRRLFWLGVGVAVGVLMVRKITRTAQAYTPQGVAASLRSSAAGTLWQARSFVSDVRAAMAEREDQIQQAVLAGQDRSAAFGRPDDPDGHQ